MALDLVRLLRDVFDPQPGESVLVAYDLPHNPEQDSAVWQERREWAIEWRSAFIRLGEERGFTTLPILTFLATGQNGAELPHEGRLGETPVNLDETLLGCTLAAFMTEYSATAALDAFCRRKQDFRAASLPGLEKRMENTSLAADYSVVARRCRILFDIMEGAEGIDVVFSSGHACYFDTRFRKPEADDGYLPRFKPGDRVINLPSGETFTVPYESEREGTPSQTAGVLPVRFGQELVLFQVEANRIVRVDGEGMEARRMREFFDADPGRTNIAEVAFGCNDRAIVTGNVLEDEKAGFHWAYGRSDHLGGIWGIAAFRTPQGVVHQDIVYAGGNPIHVVNATAVKPEGRIQIIGDGKYLPF